MKALPRLFLAGLLSLTVMISFGRDLKRIIRAIEKGDVEKTMQFIRQSLERQAVNPGARYFLALHLSYDSLPFYNIDSARVVINDALMDYDSASNEVLEELDKYQLGIDQFQDLSGQIALLHLERARTEKTQARLEAFLTHYPDSDFTEEIVKSRDSLVWHALKPKHDIREHRDFLAKYPRSFYANEAKRTLDSLVYFSAIANDRLSDYVSYLEEVPDSPYRRDAEQIIFDRMTVSSDPAVFRRFAEKYRTPRLRKQALDILFHLDPNFQPQWHIHPDSIRRISRVERTPVFPFLDKGNFSFLFSSGAKIPVENIAVIPSPYVCGKLTEDIYYAKSDDWLLFNRAGTTLFKGVFNPIKQVRDLGMGVLLAAGGEDVALLHQSGFVLAEGIEDAEFIAGNRLKVSREGRYGLISLTGYVIAPYLYDDIEREGAFCIFKKEGRAAVCHAAGMAEQLQKGTLNLDFRFDDVEVVQDSFLIGFRGDQECLLDRQLKFLVPWGAYEIYPGVPYYYTRSDSFYELYGILRTHAGQARVAQLVESEGWIAVADESSKWLVIDKRQNKPLKTEFDGVSLIGKNLCVVHRGDRTQLFLNDSTQISLKQNSRVAPASGPDGLPSGDYFTIAESGEKMLVSPAGQVLLRGVFDEITQINDSLAMVELRGEKGVYHMNGEPILDLQYDAIRESNGLLFLLRGGKFGAYDLLSGRHIEAKYEAKLERFGRFYYATRFSKKDGIIDGREEEIIPFDYSEIVFWNDSTAWLKTDYSWSLSNILTKEVYVDNVSRFETLAENENGRYGAYYGRSGYGLIGPRGQILLQDKFTDIRNVGTVEQPVFMAELYSPETDYYIVLYLNAQGNKIAANAYASDEYNRILCDN